MVSEAGLNWACYLCRLWGLGCEGDGEHGSNVLSGIVVSMKCFIWQVVSENQRVTSTRLQRGRENPPRTINARVARTKSSYTRRPPRGLGPRPWATRFARLQQWPFGLADRYYYILLPALPTTPTTTTSTFATAAAACCCY